MLPLLHWLDLQPQAYLAGVGGFFSVLTFLTARSFLREKADAVSRGPDWAWVLVWAGALLVGRWPTFLIPLGFNSDESQLLAGAHTLLHNPVFWRSVDGETAGPLNFVALWPAGWVCGWDSHLPSRVTAWIFLTLIFTAAHQCLALLYGRRLARVALLPVVAMESLTNSVDLLHYSTELLSVMLWAWAAYAAVRRWTADGGPGWSGLGGVLLGAVPFAKLQAAPLAAVFGLGWLIAELRRTGFPLARHATYLLAGALLPAALIAFQLTVAGEWHDFIPSFLLFNLYYAGRAVLAPWPLLREALRQALAEDSLLPLWLAGSVPWLALMLCARQGYPAGRRFVLACAAAALVALASIFRAGRPFVHYWQLFVLPWALLVGSAAGNLLANAAARAAQSSRWIVAIGATVLVAAMLQHRATHPNFFQGSFAHFHQHPRSELAELIRARARPDDAMAIWGICTRLYVETGLPQGARSAHFESSVTPGPLQEYFRRRFLEDVVRGKPAFFVDATGSDGLAYHAAAYAHDVNFPQLARVIHDRYELTATIGGARVYQRRQDW